jgi:hypothetical protein
MWKAKIADKKIEHGVCTVNVSYQDGPDEFNEIYTIQSLEDLNNRVRGRLEGLNNLGSLLNEIPVGNFTPEPRVEVVNRKQEALNEVSRLKQLVNLGLLEEDDQKYQDAVALYNSL